MPRRSNREHLEALVAPEVARVWPRPERRRVIILFTPRSGSSWFGDLLRSTGVLGRPDEFLNQDVNAEIVHRFGARTEIDFLNALETETASANAVFSMELIWGHVELSEFDLLGYYHDASFIYLRRKDILAQAISLLLATETGIFHNPDGAPGATQAEAAAQLVSAEKTFAGIRRWWGHLQNYECLTEVQFAIRDIKPLRLYYEDIVDAPPATIAGVLAHVGVPAESAQDPKSSHTQVRGELNDQLARLFRSGHAEFVRTMDAFRPPRI